MKNQKRLGEEWTSSAQQGSEVPAQNKEMNPAQQSPDSPPTHPCSLLGRDQLPATFPMLQFFFILLLKIFALYLCEDSPVLFLFNLLKLKNTKFAHFSSPTPTPHRTSRGHHSVLCIYECAFGFSSFRSHV